MTKKRRKAKKPAKGQSVLKWIKGLPVRVWLVSLGILLLASYSFIFFIPKNLQFSYAQNSVCSNTVSLFPELYQQNGDNTFTAKVSGGFKIGDLYVLSTQTCFDITDVPLANTIDISYSPFGTVLFQNTYHIELASTPSVINSSDRSVPQSKPLTFELDKDDFVFEYKIKINSKTVECQSKDKRITCDQSDLALQQGQSYPYELLRFINKESSSVAISGTINLLPPVKVTKSSINDKSTIYSNPTSITITVDKNLAQAKATLEKISGDKATLIETTISVDKTVITVKFKELSRKTNYRLTLKQAEATDESTINQPYVVNFTTSGGPNVSSINIGSNSIDPNATVIVTFDQTLSSSATQYASISGGSANISKDGNRIIFKLKSLPKCGAFTINIKSGIESSYGVPSDSAWSYNSRITCRSSEVIGYSVQGRAIYAYSYGSGSTVILFTGGVHGTEHSGSQTMLSWIYHLDAYGYQIPSDRKVVVVPSVNPDGLASSSRYNANNVNIGRNFPSANWESDVDLGGGETMIGGGGSEPLSEPESRALANLTTRLQPRLEVSFHAQGSLVGANQYGDSTAIANLYSSTVGYTSMVGVAEETMGYSITGEFEEWAGEQYGTPAILIELPSYWGSYFTSHKNILWRMVSI